jgi:hypothetical protein
MNHRLRRLTQIRTLGVTEAIGSLQADALRAKEGTTTGGGMIMPLSELCRRNTFQVKRLHLDAFRHPGRYGIGSHCGAKGYIQKRGGLGSRTVCTMVGRASQLLVDKIVAMTDHCAKDGWRFLHNGRCAARVRMAGLCRLDQRAPFQCVDRPLCKGLSPLRVSQAKP